MTTKEILRVNLFPNARCVASGAKPNSTNADIEAGVVSSGLTWFRFTVKNHEQVGSVYFHGLRTVPGETYVFRAKLHVTDDVQARIFDMPSQKPLVDIDIEQGLSVYKEARFTALSDQTSIRFSVPMIEGGYLMLAEPQLELASTYDAAVSGGGTQVLRLEHHAEGMSLVGRVMPDEGHEPCLGPADDEAIQLGRALREHVCAECCVGYTVAKGDRHCGRGVDRAIVGENRRADGCRPTLRFLGLSESERCVRIPHEPCACGGRGQHPRKRVVRQDRQALHAGVCRGDLHNVAQILCSVREREDDGVRCPDLRAQKRVRVSDQQDRTSVLRLHHHAAGTLACHASERGRA